ncbi:MAG: zinc ribbon domain-containing protein [Anaerolineae bacterium]|jgi:hypothetical protein|nr:zinc ribbon domain-containing protein [Anaerolineae bacterium]
MPYCPSCGAKNKDGARFCEACGAPLAVAAAPSPPAAPAQTPAAAGSFGSAKNLITVAACIYAFTVPLAAFAGPIGFLTALIAITVVLLLAYEPLRKGNVASAKTGVLIGAGLAVLYTLIDFVMGSPIAAVLNLIAGGALVAAYMQLK